MNILYDYLKSKSNIKIEDINIIFEVGAHNCRDAMIYRNLYPNSIIYAFEPNPEHYNRCRFVAKNNIYFINKAVTDFDGVTEFYPIDHNKSANSGLASILKMKDDSEIVKQYRKSNNIINLQLGPIQVDCITLNTFCKLNNINNIDILDIDTQGLEISVLNGASDILSNVKAIMLEVNIYPYYYEQKNQAININKIMDKYNFIKVDESGIAHEWQADQNYYYINKKYV